MPPRNGTRKWSTRFAQLRWKGSQIFPRMGHFGMDDVVWWQASDCGHNLEAERWYFTSFTKQDYSEMGLLGGSSHVHRVGGLVHPSYKWTTCPHLSHWNHQGYNPLTKWDEPRSINQLTYDSCYEPPSLALALWVWRSFISRFSTIRGTSSTGAWNIARVVILGAYFSWRFNP